MENSSYITCVLLLHAQLCQEQFEQALVVFSSLVRYMFLASIAHIFLCGKFLLPRFTPCPCRSAVFPSEGFAMSPKDAATYAPAFLAWTLSSVSVSFSLSHFLSIFLSFSLILTLPLSVSTNLGPT